MPKQYTEFEDGLRKQIAKTARRGRIEVFIQIESTDIENKTPRLNFRLARFYWEQLQELHRQLPGIDAPKLEHLMRIPYLFESSQNDYDRDLLKDLINEALAQTLEQTHSMRLEEGKALMRDLLDRLSEIRRELSFVESQKDVILEAYQSRLRDRIQEIMGGLEPDGNRVLQEIACLAERSDINEEIVRLKSHLGQIEELLSSSKMADGRRLDFLVQELHREVNTIGCKTADLEAIQAVVTMKSEIGKLKEQVQNVE
jgi:uncharacterized protein (TIGR00255 family)